MNRIDTRFFTGFALAAAIAIGTILLVQATGPKFDLGDCVKHINNEHSTFMVLQSSHKASEIRGIVGIFMVQEWVPNSKLEEVSCED